MFHKQARINFVTDGTLTYAKCIIKKLGLILLLMAHPHVPSVSLKSWN